MLSRALRGRQRGAEKCASSASTSGPSLGGCGSRPTTTPCSRSAALHTGPIEATSVRPRSTLSAASRPAPAAISNRWCACIALVNTTAATSLRASASSSRIYGSVAGADYRLSPDTRLGFALAGGAFIRSMGIGIDAFRIGGGIMLFLMALEMVFARESGTRQTSDEAAETRRREEELRAKTPKAGADSYLPDFLK